MLSYFVFMYMILVDFFIESSNCLRAKVVCCDWGPYFLMRDLLNVALAHSDDSLYHIVAKLCSALPTKTAPASASSGLPVVMTRTTIARAVHPTTSNKRARG